MSYFIPMFSTSSSDKGNETAAPNTTTTAKTTTPPVTTTVRTTVKKDEKLHECIFVLCKKINGNTTYTESNGNTYTVSHNNLGSGNNYNVVDQYISFFEGVTYYVLPLYDSFDTYVDTYYISLSNFTVYDSNEYNTNVDPTANLPNFTDDLHKSAYFLSKYLGRDLRYYQNGGYTTVSIKENEPDIYGFIYQYEVSYQNGIKYYFLKVNTTYAVDSTGGEYYGEFVVNTETNEVCSKEEFEQSIINALDDQERLNCVYSLLDYSYSLLDYSYYGVIKFHFKDYSILIGDESLYDESDYNYIKEEDCSKSNDCWYIPLIYNYFDGAILRVYEVNPITSEVMEIEADTQVYKDMRQKIWGY